MRPAANYRFNQFAISEYMGGAVDRYINHGIEPGDFLTAVICNDLIGAVGSADDVNLQNLPAYAAYFYNNAPRSCYGSREKMEAWIISGGLSNGTSS